MIFFHFLLKDKAKIWLDFLTLGTITMWEELAQKFQMKYFLLAKIVKLRNDITTFIRWDNDLLYEVWESFRDLLRKCPNHDIPIWLQIKTFYNGLGATNHSMLDATTGGTFINKTLVATYKCLEKLASKNYK